MFSLPILGCLLGLCNKEQIHKRKAHRFISCKLLRHGSPHKEMKTPVA